MEPPASSCHGVVPFRVVHSGTALKRSFHQPVHSFFLLDDRLHQLHLGAAAVEVVAFAVDLVVDVAREIVRQEPDHLLERDELAAEDQVLPFRRRQESARLLDEALRQGLEQVDIDGDLRQVPLILRRRAGGRPDEVAEIVDGQAGHHRVEIDHADALARCSCRT